MAIVGGGAVGGKDEDDKQRHEVVVGRFHWGIDSVCWCCFVGVLLVGLRFVCCGEEDCRGRDGAKVCHNPDRDKLRAIAVK